MVLICLTSFGNLSRPLQTINLGYRDMKPFDRLRIGLKRLDEFAPDPRNARTHSKEQIELVAKSIEEFGFINPIIIDEAGSIMAGHPL